MTKVLAIYIRVISNWYEKAARRNGISGKTAAVTFVQRFGGAINLNVHFHSLFLDGIFTEKNGKPHFVPVFPPTNEEIVTLQKIYLYPIALWKFHYFAPAIREAFKLSWFPMVTCPAGRKWRLASSASGLRFPLKYPLVYSLVK